MINLSTSAKELHHYVRLNSSFRSDLQWWSSLLAELNGISVMTNDSRTAPQAVITSDASGNWGCGAFSSDSNCFQLQWPNTRSSIHITVNKVYFRISLKGGGQMRSTKIKAGSGLSINYVI